MDGKFAKLKNESREIRLQAKEKTVGFILTALGLVAGLAWNDAIKAIINLFIKAPQNSIVAQVIYAVIITLIVVVVTVYLTRLAKKNEENKQH